MPQLRSSDHVYQEILRRLLDVFGFGHSVSDDELELVAALVGAQYDVCVKLGKCPPEWRTLGQRHPDA